ncbi:two-component sensor histidine kinase [Lentzea guizhouensis]|uniref:histidine kinase n=1 Tax=Lentzea guizhouensis TaxID=1586287 RepID=A0A1B2HXW4_9PSEU|nr:histidine kinase [Lentzea guizhouensis]ANZ42543.1 two-component sensor histidine kinase [Lentzea guizhouensis]
MHTSRPAPWVSPVLCAAVLVAGVYAAVAGLGVTRLPLLVGGLVVLVAVDLVEHRRYPVRTPRPVAAGLLVVRTALYVGIAYVDGSGLARLLLLLVPLTAYFAFGQRVAVALAVVCLAVAVVSTPQWYAHVEKVSDLVMFTVGLVLTVAMAAVAVRERDGRIRLQESHRTVAELSAAAERARVARDLHDDLGHHLTAIVVQLEKAAAFHDREPATAKAAVLDAGRSARRALGEVRESVRSLRSFHLLAALDELAGDDVALVVSGSPEGHETGALHALYRAAQEGITNSRRHAEATSIAVAVDLDAEHARVTVTDDGRGMGTAVEGFGLLGMRERVALAGGRVELASTTAGTRLTVTIPAARPV